MAFTPHITVASIVEQDGRFLFVRERTSRGIVINQPAGHLDPDETLEQAAVRETWKKPAGTLSHLPSPASIFIWRPTG